jgi:uncharacterized membrane protein
MPAATKNSGGGGMEAALSAIDGLTFREMLALSRLVQLQAEGRTLTEPQHFAELLADTCDSFFDGED